MSQTEYKKSNEDRQKEVAEITSKMPEEIEKCRNSEEYKEKLKAIGKLHNYSLNNCMLIGMQCPDATYVAGYKAWEKFGRHVNKGEKGIKIIQPAPFKKTEWVDFKDENGNVVRNESGNPVKEKVETIIPAYKVGHVFDIGQTSGRPFPEICHKLEADVDGYDRLMDAIRMTSPVPVMVHQINSHANGYYEQEKKLIHVKDDMSELQTIKTTLHEIAHAILHDRDTGTDIETDRATREVQAESVAFTVASYYGLDTSDYSFGYIAEWSKDKDLKEFTESLETIRKTAGDIIEKIDKYVMKQEIDKTENIIFRNGPCYVEFNRTEDGYKSTIYDANFISIKEASIEGKHLSMDQAIDRLCSQMSVPRDALTPANQKHLRPILDAAVHKPDNLIADARMTNVNTHKVRI